MQLAQHLNILSLQVASIGRLVDGRCDNDNKCNGNGNCNRTNSILVSDSCICNDGFYLLDCSLNNKAIFTEFINFKKMLY